jgi:hypothetical protein
VKTADISDADFLRAVEQAIPPRALMATSWDVQRALYARLEPAGLPLGAEMNKAIEARIPLKIVLSKASRVIGRRLLLGCTCGCWGGFELTDFGRQQLASEEEGTDG